MKRVFIFILNFLLIIILTILCIVTILSKTVLNKSYIAECLEKSNFYNELNMSIQNEFDTYLAQAGIETGALNGIYTIEELKEDINNTLEAVYNNTEINEKVSFMTERIKAKLRTYTNNAEGIAINITNAYNKKVVISAKYIRMIGNKMTKLISLVKMGIVATAVLFVIVLIIMCAIIGNFKVIINHIGILLVTTGILNIIIKICVGSRFNHMFLLNPAFSTGIVYIINNVVDKIMSIGIGLTVIGTIFIICGNFKNIDKKEEMEN